MTTTYNLPGHLDSSVAAQLTTQLLEHRGKPLCVDACTVTFVGTLPLQVLVAARKQWVEDDQSFEINPVSQAFVESAKGLGVALSDIGAADAEVLVEEGSA